MTARDVSDRDGSGSEHSRQLRGSSLLLLGRVVAMAINFATTILIIRYLAKADYGAFAYALSIVALVQAALQLGLDRALTRYVPIYDEMGDHDRVFGTISFVVGTVVTLGTVVVLVTITAQSVMLGRLVDDPAAVSLLAILIVLGPIEALDNLLISLFAAFEQTWAIFLRRYVVGPLLRLAVVGLLLASSGTVELLAIGYVVAGALGLVVFGGHLIGVLRERRRAAGGSLRLRLSLVEILTFAIPLLTTDLVFMTLNATDAVMLELFGSVEDVASIRAVMPTAKVNQVVLASFGILYVPFIARLFVRADHSEIRRRYWSTAQWVLVLSFPILALTILFSSELTGDLLGDEYADSAIILAVLSLGYYTNALFGFNGMTLNVYRKVAFIVVVNLSAVAGNIALNLALIPGWGPLGAAAATAATFVLHNLLKQYGLVRHARIGGPERSSAGLYATVIVSAVVAIAMAFGTDLGFWPRAAGFAVLSLAVVTAGRRVLSLDSVFPEMAQIPGVRWLARS